MTARWTTNKSDQSGSALQEYRSRTRWALVGGVLIMLLVPLYLGLLLTNESKAARDAYQWIEHTHEVLDELKALQNAVRQCESEQRAFILTNDERFILPYRAAGMKAPKVLQEIRSLVQDNPAQVRNVAILDTVLKHRLAILEENTRLANGSTREEILTRLSTGAAKSAELERLITLMEEEEVKLLQNRRSEYDNRQSSLQRSAATAIALGACLMLGISYLLVQENRRRKAYEARIAEARDAALDAVSATSSFVASVSHEIRTPMNGVLGSADLLLRDPALTSKQRTGLETIKSSCRALLSLMNDILDLSKVQAGQMTFVAEDFSPNEVVEEVMTLFAPAASRKGIELTYQASGDVPAQVKGDRLRLRQVLSNLVSNAVKFTERGGVTIHILRRPQVEQNAQVILRFDVRDTGPGISENAQQQLFRPFAQVDSKLAQRHGGTGLGLAISKELVQRMNGTMDVESALGQGSTFWFTATFGIAESDTALMPSAELRGRKIIIVESRPLTAEAIRAHVEGWGMNSLMFKDPTLIPDNPLPSWGADMNGVAVVLGLARDEMQDDAVRSIRSKPWLSNAPLALISDTEVTLEHVSKLGAGAILHYPFRPSELYDWLAGSAGKASLPKDSARSLLPPATIIVADDNPVNQQVISNQLEHLGMRAVRCANGLEAVGRVQEGAGELVLMDCQMPDMDGFEASRVIRAWEQDEQRTRIPIIAITANVMAGDAEQCLRAGMDGYLAKPIDLEALEKALERWLRVPTEHPPNGSHQPSSSSSVADPDPVLDEAQMKSCLTGEQSLDQDLIRMAVRQVVEQMARMEAGMSEENLKDWVEGAHRARGSSAYMGFVELAKVFQKAEYEAETPEARATCIEDLRRSLAKLEIRLKEAGFDLPATAAPSHPPV